MPTVQLTCHPDTPCDAVSAIDVDVYRPSAGRLDLVYTLSGDLARVRLAAPAASERTDELWRHTCFEAFLHGHDGGYAEFNLSPSTQWAAYRFDGYRAGMAALDLPASPLIERGEGPGTFALSAALETGVDTPSPWRLSLTAVIEETSGRLSYWALTHPPGKPDFHHLRGAQLQVDLPGT